MSKVSKLKQEAYQAGKKRDWDKVIDLYERILELEKNNPSLINELGDACLKRGDIPRAIEHFLSAAEKYRLTSLLNNAVAIYKKILRFDPGNMNAHWYLAESRASQGLAGEGAAHALQFLIYGERMGADFREAFVKRAVRLLALFPSEAELLTRLAELFRAWALPLEGARVALLQACLVHERGDRERAQSEATALLAEFPELADAPEHLVWRRRLGEQTEEPDGAEDFADHNAIELGPPAGSPSRLRSSAAMPGAPPPAGNDGQGSLAQSLGLVDFGGVAAAPAGTDSLPLGSLDGAPGAPADGADSDLLRSAPASLFSSEGDEAAGDGDSETLADQAAAPVAPDQGCFEIALEDVPSFADLARELAGESAAPAAAAPAAPPVDLLAEILAEEDDAAAAGGESRQVETIVNEIGQQVGGPQGQDPGAQYDMALVYLEMELYGQAEECFEAASRSPAHALRSYEMWGIALIRQGRHEEAVDILGRGLRVPGAAAGDLLGLLYHTGQAYELAGRTGAAREYYERVHQAAPNFLDIERRLESLESV